LFPEAFWPWIHPAQRHAEHAAVGVGGMGRANLINLASQNIVALCDVDWRYADKGFDHLDIDIERLKKRIELPAPAQPGESSPRLILSKRRPVSTVCSS